MKWRQHTHKRHFVNSPFPALLALAAMPSSSTTASSNGGSKHLLSDLMKVEELLPFFSSVLLSLGDRLNNCISGDDLPLFAMADYYLLCAFKLQLLPLLGYLLLCCCWFFYWYQSLSLHYYSTMVCSTCHQYKIRRRSPWWLLSHRRLSKDSRRYYCCVPMLRRLPPIAQSSYCQLLWRLLLHPAVLKDWPRTSPRGVAFMLQCFFTFIGAHKIEKDWRFQYYY